MNFYVPNMVILGLVCQCIKISTRFCNIVVALFPGVTYGEPGISEREKVAKGGGGRVWEIVSPGLYEAALSNLQRRKIRPCDKWLLTCGLNCHSYK